MSLNDRQNAFNRAVKALLEAFPRRGNLVSMDALWDDNSKYLPQIASLAHQWNDSHDSDGD